jgi:hypothetical protein
MPYFKNNDINILFIHIPKTGGTSVDYYFSSKFNIILNEDSLFSTFSEEEKLNNINNNINIKSNLQHITYTEIIEYNNIFNIDFDNIKIITIVRNPYERIISDLFWFSKINLDISFSKINLDSTKEEVFNIIKEYIQYNWDNHSLPQHIFVTDDSKQLIPNINILHSENLTYDMQNLGYKDFDLIMNNNKDKLDYYNYLNNDSIKFINDYYDYDFILFNYTKKSVF